MTPPPRDRPEPHESDQHEPGPTEQQIDALRAELRRIGEDESAQTPIPFHVEHDILAALAAERAVAHTETPDTDSTVTPLRRRRRFATAASALAAAAAVAIGLVMVVSVRGGVQDGGEGSAILADPHPGTNAPTELPDDPPVALFATLAGTSDPGPFADPAVLRACLAASDVAPDTPVLGSQRVRFRGTDAVALLTPGPTPGALTALVVDTLCSSDHAGVLWRQDIG
ncbi:hypothetical protein DW322_04915 [Rhodococcus rhodnii]|uniref:Anti-sigma-M factor RsmA n=2 Tax=Rhodococcus rhodnii TaxID=38312 RepID=R7WK16_9NOCA|nr:hypothetical protein [Rhodococcus rhodnii]EOM75666.1 hypothetical protein Rrhod_2936 [Rhodococcus rhodnii LMG 5362]TXG89684.1 hypothetical protein DW322_04915 [Rhodococcus rhodnii]